MCSKHPGAKGICTLCTTSLLDIVNGPPSEHVEVCNHPESACVCMHCGVERPGGLFALDAAYTYPRGHEVSYRRKQPYTRAKRFRKYLMRACMSQGLSSIPDETWQYLEEHKPYSGPMEILFRLKRSSLTNKCYDSLPIMTKHMCPHLKVPLMTQMDATAAKFVFNEIDGGFPRSSKFVSYLYVLEHVLVRIGRGDMLPFLNRIQCPKRRREYEERIRNATSSVSQVPQASEKQSTSY